MNEAPDLSGLDLVYCFQTRSFERALDDWTAAPIQAYPDRERDIRVAARAMRDFMISRFVVEHHLVVREVLDRALAQRR